MNSSHSQTCRLYPTVCTGHQAPATAILVSLMAGSRYNRLPSRCWVQTNSCRSTFHPTRSHRSTGLALDPRPKWRLSNEMLQKPSPFRVWAKGASFRQLDSSDLSLLPAGYEVKHGETEANRLLDLRSQLVLAVSWASSYGAEPTAGRSGPAESLAAQR